MKTTIELPDELLLRAKQAALERGTSLKEVVQSALLLALGRVGVRQPLLRTVIWPPANLDAPPVSSNDILHLIRLERDRSSPFTQMAETGKASAKPRFSSEGSPESIKVRKRRK